MSSVRAAFRVALALTWPLCAYAQSAEFAIRWDRADGGPQSLSEIRTALGLAEGNEKAFQVQYLAIDQPSGAVRAIARQRTQQGGAAESTYKLRGPKTAGAAIGTPVCPLAGKKPETKLEYDVAWTLLPTSAKQLTHTSALSWSCTVEAEAKDAFPSSLHARPFPCRSTMRRLKANDLKIEHWTLPSGRQVFEVSMDAASVNDWRTFERAVAKPLVGLKVKPLTQGMTELGSTCPP